MGAGLPRHREGGQGEEKDFDQILKGAGPCPPPRPKFANKTRLCSRAFRRRELCRLQMRLLYLVCGDTPLVVKALRKPFLFILSSFQCLGFSSATEPHLCLEYVFFRVLQLSYRCHFSLSSFVTRPSNIHSFIHPFINSLHKHLLDA